MRILICDYDEKYMESLMSRIKAVSEEEVIFESYTDTQGAARRIGMETFDMAYFGPMVNGNSGFELGEVLKLKQPECVLFYICDDYKYMHQVFQIRAFQLILKSKDELVEREFKRAYDVHLKRRYVIPFVCSNGERMEFIPSEVLYIQTNRSLPLVVTVNGRFRGRLDNLPLLKKKLREYYFFQTHQSYFVNMKHIGMVRSGELELDNGDFVPVSVMNERFVDDAICGAFSL